MHNGLKEKIKHIPEAPGIYFLKDKKGEVLYIGKARNLKNRISTYFHESPALLEPRLQSMINKIANVDYIVTKDEIESTLLEARMIRDTKPRYNIRLKDDKSFLCIGITKSDDFPKIRLVRETDRGSQDLEYFGPYVNSDDLRTAIKVLQKIFKFATCNIPIFENDSKRKFFRPCLLYSLKRCSAPCAAKISKRDYNLDVKSFKDFLQGNRKSLLKNIKQQMKEAAANLEFERASELRDQINSIKILTHKGTLYDFIEGDITPIDARSCVEDLTKLLNLNFTPRKFEGIDIANLGKGEAVGSVVVFFDGVPFKDGYRRFRIKMVKAIDDYGMIKEVVLRRLRRLIEENQPMPDVLLIDGGLGHLNSAKEALKKIKADIPVLLSIAKKTDTVFQAGKNKPVNLPKHSPALRLLKYIRDEAHRFAQHYHHILRRKATIGE
jgi:excinuclease ABC subunit C